MYVFTTAGEKTEGYPVIAERRLVPCRHSIPTYTPSHLRLAPPSFPFVLLPKDIIFNLHSIRRFETADLLIIGATFIIFPVTGVTDALTSYIYGASIGGKDSTLSFSGGGASTRRSRGVTPPELTITNVARVVPAGCANDDSPPHPDLMEFTPVPPGVCPE